MFSNYLGGTVGCPCLIVIVLFSHLVSGSLQYEVDLYLVSSHLSILRIISNGIIQAKTC